MKKKMNKSILLSALSALAIGGIGAGATFALFTDRATTTVEIAAGKLDINSAIQNFKVYSVKENNIGQIIDENTNGYDLEEQTVVEEGKHLFKNEGWATYSNDNNGINLVHMSPGDKVTFTLAIDNGQTNINYLYRLHFRSTGSDNLVKGLVTTIGSEKLAGLKQYDSAWMAKTPNDSLDAIDFAIEMPVEKDNRYQMLEASFIVGIEAVQGNAIMTDAATKVQIEEDVIAKGNVVNNESINLNANAGNTNIATTASIPANEIAEGEVTYTVSNIVVNDAQGSNESTIGFDIDFKVNDVAHNTFNQPITVTFDIGAGKVLQGVYHDGVLMNENDYGYNVDTGILTISSSSFSPFTVKYQNEAEQQPEQSSSEEVTSEIVSEEESEQTSEQAATYTDVLDRELTGVDASSSYVSWSDLTDESGVVYAGNSAGDNDSIQLRSKNNNSGIVVTANPDSKKAVKIILDWNAATTSTRILKIYGNETAYGSPSELYGSKKGNEIGQLAYGETEIDLTDGYEFIGLRSADAAMYLNSITIVWSD